MFAIPYVVLSCSAWSLLAWSGVRHFRSTERLREYIDARHPELWDTMFRWKWQRANSVYTAFRPWALDQLIYFWRSAPVSESDPEFARLLRDSRRSAVLMIVFMVPAFVSLAGLPFPRD